jgi:hypothetical protein
MVQNIIGYIHVCQKGDWKRSFKMLISSIKDSKLYDEIQIIRIGIVNDVNAIIDDEIFNDTKFEIFYFGDSSQYERPTLLHMRKMSEEDTENTVYFYLHTKGISHFGTPKEPFVIDWINLMLYWTIEKWKLALNKLQTYDTYGCNDIGYHYSGNFWWATKRHILKLPTKIEAYYNGPEDWIQIVRTNKICIYNSGFEGFGHYSNAFPREFYSIDNTIMKTFSILIATLGRPTLQNMLDSLSPQLHPSDCLTIVFDGHSSVPFGFDFSKFMCKVTTYSEPVALGYWGHGVRNKYASLIEKKDFVMHADDDNTYVPDAFKVIRNTCIDENTLYVFKMMSMHQKPFPENHKIKEFNVDTGMGAIPYELNKKGVFLYGRHSGDGIFYEMIAQQAKNIVFSDFVTFKMRPHLWNLPAPAPAPAPAPRPTAAKQLKFFGGKLNLL